jgi:hypothetical protein
MNLSEKTRTILIITAFTVSILAVIGYFFFFTATYTTGFSYCGKGAVTEQSVGFSRGAGRMKTGSIDQECPQSGYAGSYATLSVFVGASAVATLEGEGTIRVFVKKNGVMCDEKIVSGKGKFTAKATCH